MTALLSPTSSAAPLDPEAFRYIHSSIFPAILERLNSSLLVSTYQLGKLALFRVRHERLTMLLRTFDKAMGLAVDRDRLAIGTKNSIWLLRNDATTAADLDPPGRRMYRGRLWLLDSGTGRLVTVDERSGSVETAVIGLQKDDVNHRYVVPAPLR